MAATLQVQVGADIQGLQTGLNNAERSVNSFSRDVQQQTQRVGVSFVGMSRVIQDAAFGPGAIANNLAGIGDDFRQLGRTAQETGQSIGRTLVNSLIGGGGLNIALSALTFGLSVASFGLQAWTRALGGNENQTKKTASSIDDYVKSLGAVNQALTQGSVDVQKETTNLTLLFNAYQNANLPLKERKKAYKELQELYPDYFGNLKFEKEASDRTKKAYDDLTQALLATARARAAADLIAKNSTQILINEQKIIEENARIDKIGIDKAAQAEKNRRRLERNGLFASEAEISKQQAAQQEFDIKAESSKKNINSLTEANNVLTERNLRLVDLVNQQLEKGATLTGDVGKENEKVVETIKNKIKELPGITAGIGVQSADFFIEKLRQRKIVFDVAFNPVTRGLETLSTLKVPELDFSGIGKINERVQKNLFPVLDTVNKFNDQIISALKNGAIAAFENLGTAIGNALATGGNVIEAVGLSLLGSLGDILVQMGKMTIAAGVASTALFQALSNPLNPLSGPAAIAAGAALVAIGSLVKSFSSSIGGGGKGGGTTGAVGIPGSGFSPAAPVNFGANTGNNVFIAQTTLKGQDIVMSFNRTTSLNNRMGR